MLLSEETRHIFIPRDQRSQLMLISLIWQVTTFYKTSFFLFRVVAFSKKHPTFFLIFFIKPWIAVSIFFFARSIILLRTLRLPNYVFYRSHFLGFKYNPNLKSMDKKKLCPTLILSSRILKLCLPFSFVCLFSSSLVFATILLPAEDFLEVTEKRKKNHVGFCKEAWTHCLGASPCEAQFAPIKLEIFNLEQASCLVPTFCQRNKINQHIFKILKNHWLKVVEIAKIFKEQKRILYF